MGGEAAGGTEHLRIFADGVQRVERSHTRSHDERVVAIGKCGEPTIDGGLQFLDDEAQVPVPTTTTRRAGRLVRGGGGAGRRHGGRCVLCGGGERREDRRERRAERAEYQNAMTHDCAPALNLTRRLSMNTYAPI